MDGTFTFQNGDSARALDQWPLPGDGDGAGHDSDEPYPTALPPPPDGRTDSDEIALREEGGPTNLEREDDFDADGGLDGLEQRWLDSTDEQTKAGYLRAKVWQSQYPPNSQPTDITLSQFLSIQEKGVSAWSFEPDYESNPALIVESRTEITFLADGVGMAPEEGGGCCVQSNLPLPKLNEVYYWECKMYEKPEGTTVAIGLATKPFPSFRLPGLSKYSVGYFSSDGFKSHSFPFTGQSYGPPLTEGDVLGVGYRPRSGTVFFTRNGKKLEDAFIGLNRHNLFPTVGANSACTVHVNLGQAGFVFIEANVKKWGLAPMMGTLAPPPAYGSEGGSILLDSAVNGAASPSRQAARRIQNTIVEEGGGTRSAGAGGEASGSRRSTSNRHRTRRRESHPPVPSGSASAPTNAQGAVSALGSPSTSSSHVNRPSPLRHSRQPSSLSNLSHRSSNSNLNNAASGELSPEDDDSDRENIQNPPTPGLFDVSLQSLHRFPQEFRDEDESGASGSGSGSGGTSPGGSEDGEERTVVQPSPQRSAFSLNVAPPAYFPVDPNA
ncbi:hypothetical protein MNV49_005227 [Pseudohyphozyma bogoriensis]|nr:hypothetical protein MNV49_005227 [Pseudohyphozyma bogoriensis]